MKPKLLFSLFAIAIMLMAALPTQAQKNEAYVVVSDNGATLTFYYDMQKSNRKGTVYSIDATVHEGMYPAWAGTTEVPNSQITMAVFDTSFKKYRPKETRCWFYNCRTLKEIKGIENLNTSEVTDMGDTFSGCTALTSLNLSKFNTENVTNMQRMFMHCIALTALDLSSFNTKNVTNMSHMFFNCKALSSLNLSSFNTKNVRNMSSMFSVCAD